jgi:hypothetical protein
MKKLFLVLLFIILISPDSKAEENIYVFGKGSVLSGFNIYNKETGKLLCYAVATTDGKFDCKVNSDSVLSKEEISKIITEVLVTAIKDIELEAIPIYYDDPEPDPEPEWEANKENAFVESCTACHSEETDKKYDFAEWNKEIITWEIETKAPKDKGHKKHLTADDTSIICTSCHRRI